MASEWIETELQEIAAKIDRAFAMGPFGSNIKAENYREAGVPVIRGTNLREVGDAPFVAEDFVFLDEAKADELASSNCAPGDIVFVAQGTVGKVGIVPANTPYNRFVLSQNLMKVTVDPTRADPRFVFYFYRSKIGQHEIMSRVNPTGVPCISKPLTSLRQFGIRLPVDVNEQRAIAHILGTLDDKIELNRRMNETLEAMARALFKSWFVDFDPVRAKASGERSQSICRRLGLTPDLLALFPNHLVDSELGGIPEGWNVKAVDKLAQIVKGKSYKSRELAPSKTALVTLKSFNRGGGYRLDGLKEYTGSYKPEQEVFGGDLIVAYTDVTQAADVIGKPALVISDDAYDHLVISLDVAAIRPLRDEYRVYLYGVMSGVQFQQHTHAHTTGTTVLHLASNAVPSFKLAFPGDALVNAYAGVAIPIFASIDQRVAESRTLASLRNTLLPKLVSGELPIPLAGAV